jgi:AraC-like DNA-binding protein
MHAMPALDALHVEMALRGAVAGLLLFHAMNLALPGPRPPARLALIGFVMSVLAYLFCQQAEVLLFLPRPLAYGLLAWCVGGAAWLWVAARALFDDHFRWSVPVLALLVSVTVIGLMANLPYFPDGTGPYRSFPADAPVVWLGYLHSLCMLSFSVLALWEVARGWRGDLVESRRVARRWVAMGIGLYAGLALVIEIALKGQPVGRLLPALHVLGIGAISFGLALLVARRSLSEVLGFTDADPPLEQPFSAQGNETRLPPPVAGPTNDKVTRRLEELKQAMVQGRAYRREGLSLSDLAQTMNMPEATLRDLINQRLGYRNFNDFLHHHRLREATERLSREDLPILTIALECGYGSIGPFNRAFKQRMGVTPSEFRAGARLAQGAPGPAVAPSKTSFDQI